MTVIGTDARPNVRASRVKARLPHIAAATREYITTRLALVLPVLVAIQLRQARARRLDAAAARGKAAAAPAAAAI